MTRRGWGPVSLGHTGAVTELNGDGLGADAQPLPVPPPRPNGSILMAAMLGLANALGMEPKREATEMAQPARPRDDDELDLQFGSLRPLDE